MSRKYVLGSLALAAALGTTGCVVEGQARVAEPVATVEVESEPPPPQYEEVVVRPGFVWVGGRWNWEGGRWVWMRGRYQQERVGYVWAPGRWERRGNRHVWIEGEWRDGGHGPVVRDHRR